MSTRAKIRRGTEVPRQALPHGRGESLKLIEPGDGAAFSVQINEFAAGGRPGSYHFHEQADNAYYILSGRLKAVIDGQEVLLEQGDVALIPRGVHHGAHNPGPEPCRLLEIHSPALNGDRHDVLRELPLKGGDEEPHD